MPLTGRDHPEYRTAGLQSNHLTITSLSSIPEADPWKRFTMVHYNDVTGWGTGRLSLIDGYTRMTTSTSTEPEQCIFRHGGQIIYAASSFSVTALFAVCDTAKCTKCRPRAAFRHLSSSTTGRPFVHFRDTVYDEDSPILLFRPDGFQEYAPCLPGQKTTVEQVVFDHGRSAVLAKRYETAMCDPNTCARCRAR